MNRKVFIAAGTALSLMLGSALVVSPGCAINGEFLGLEDFQRDILIGGLAAAVLNQLAADGGDDGAGAPVGQDGADGLNCWDLDEDAVEDAEEDINGDGRWDAQDCRGPDGVDGNPPAPDGQDGQDGLHCWDANGNGVGDSSEDHNRDGRFDALDCQGSDGAAGADGSDGSPGPAGEPGQDAPSFFDIFIDDFFVAELDQGEVSGFPTRLTVNAVPIEEPRLPFQGPIAFRMAVPTSYQRGHDVTMRLYFYRTGFTENDCFVMTLDARRLRVGAGIEVYGDDCADAKDQDCGRRWIRFHADVVGDIAEGGKGDGDPTLVVVDLPLNSVDGLNLERDLADADKLDGKQFLAFEINDAESSEDDRVYQIIGVEFFESPAGTARLIGGTVYLDDRDEDDGIIDEQFNPCAVTDCNNNGIPDHLDIKNCPDDDPSCRDCNDNRIPDECDIRDCPLEDVKCQDCNDNQVPDECDLCVNRVETGFAASVAGTNLPFTFLHDGFTQELYATAPGFMGGVAFAPDGDVLVNRCPGPGQNYEGSDLRRFDHQSTVVLNGGAVHPLIVTMPSNAGCGMVNYADGLIYTNTGSGVRGLDPDTGATVRAAFGPGGNGLGMTVDPQTGDLNYVGLDGSILGVDHAFTTNYIFSSVTAGRDFVEYIQFDPSGEFLFAATRGDPGDPDPLSEAFLTVIRRDGTLVQDIPIVHDGSRREPDGIAFHASTPRFVVTTNLDGTMSRFDFADDDYTQAPAITLFASGGFRGDFTQVGADGRLYLTQNGTRFADGTTAKGTGQNSVVAICCGFNPPVPGDITLSPREAINVAGDNHTVIARVSRQSEALEGMNIAFDIVAGPNAGAHVTSVTDATGRAFFLYPGANGPGVDEIQATFEDETGLHVSNVVTKEWLPADCSNDCNENGVPDECELEGDDCNENGVLDECEVDVCDDGDPCTRDFCDGGCFNEPLCGGGLVCVEGDCRECRTHEDCPKGEFCVAGECQIGD